MQLLRTLLVVLLLHVGTPFGQTITLFSDGLTPGVEWADIRAIARGADGNLWFTESAGRIGRITTAGVITEFSAGLSFRPGSIALGPDGNMWFTERAGAKVGKITPAGVITEFSQGISAGARIFGITSGPDGNLWYSACGTQKIGRITTSGVVTEFAAGIPAGACPSGITQGPDGNIWFADQQKRIGRITTAGVVTMFTAGLPTDTNGGPVFITAGPDGNLWFTITNGSRVGRITPAGVITVFSVPGGADPNPWQIVTGSDGNLWVTNYYGSQGRLVWKLTTSGVATAFTVASSAIGGGYPQAIASGPDGSLWIGHDINYNYITRMTTEGAQTHFSEGITKTVPFPQPYSIVSGSDGNLWAPLLGSRRFAKITMQGKITEISPNPDLSIGASLVFAPDGNGWFGSYNSVAYVTLAGETKQFGLGGCQSGTPNNYPYSGLPTLGPDGNVWVVVGQSTASGQYQHCIAKVTLAGVASKVVTLSSDLAPAAMAAGPDGNMWFVGGGGSSPTSTPSVGRISPTGEVATFPTGVDSRSLFTSIVAGPDGNMWFTDRLGQIGRITMTGTVTFFNQSTGNALLYYQAITAGPDGSLWFTRGGNGVVGSAIGRITTSGVVTIFGEGILTNSSRWGITAGPDANIWFTEYSGNKIGRLTTGLVPNNIEFPIIPTQNLASATYTLSATSTSGGNVAFTSATPSVCAVNGRTVAFVQAGTCTIAANQAGGSQYAQAPQVLRSFQITSLLVQTIAFNPVPNRALGSAPLTLSASASSLLPVTFSSLTPSVCTVSGLVVTNVAVGTCTIAGNQGGNATLGAAQQVTQSFQVTAGNPPSPAVRGAIDLDGNGRNAFLLRSATARMLVGRFTNGAFLFSALTDPGSAFRLVGVGDFDGNGKSDLAFQNMTQGELGDIKIWKDFSPSNEIYWRQVKQVWDVQATGDLDGDGFSDMVWRYVVTSSADTGVSYVWFTNGSSVTQVRKRGGAPLDWQLLGAADLNGDRAADMVYINPAGQVRVLMATPGRTCANLTAGSIPAGYSALKLADFTGSGRAEILIKNAAGQAQLLALNGSGLTLPPYMGAPDDQNAACTSTSLAVGTSVLALPNIDPSWQYYVSGDFNGDGIADIVWVRPDGTLTMWQMNAGLLTGNSAAPTVLNDVGSAPQGYSVFNGEKSGTKRLRQ